MYVPYDIINKGTQTNFKYRRSHLQAACEYLGLSGISTHSFRKYFATQIYINNGYNIKLVRQLLQHSSSAVTQKYIGIQSKQLESALQNHIKLL
ncbi:MAG: tyrosine-type recombinase/integrase [Lachnospiraceae bacterium]|nr:tyrosine-type recombinase/integrase [Lachnospiraceae bacterium]